MAESTLSLPGQATEKPKQALKVQTYWGAVSTKLWHDKITILAILLGLFIIGISVGAPFIGNNILGFDPTDTNLRKRNDPPTWLEEGWPKFQDFGRTCQR